MSPQSRIIWHRTWGAAAALMSLVALVVSAAGIAAVPQTVADERLYLQARPCPGSVPAPTENCLHARTARVAGVVIRDEPKHEEFTLRLRAAPGLPEEIDMGSRGPLLPHLTPGDEVTLTLWRDYTVAVARDGAVQETADTPEGEAAFITAFVLALTSAGVPPAHRRLRARPCPHMGDVRHPAVLVFRTKWAFGSALCALPALVLATLSGLGPVAEILAWCAMVPLVRRYLRWKSDRERGRHARPLTTRSPIR